MYQVRDDADRDNQRPAGGDHRSQEYRTNVYNENDDIHSDRPSGTSVEAALRRLRKDRPDLHTRVLAGELTANAATSAPRSTKPPMPRTASTNARSAPTSTVRVLTMKTMMYTPVPPAIRSRPRCAACARTAPICTLAILGRSALPKSSTSARASSSGINLFATDLALDL
jgi:hypothetical protein